MRPPADLRGTSSVAAPLIMSLLIMGVAACGGEAPVRTPPTSSAPPAAAPGARADLAARAALALDKAYAGLYTMTSDGRTQNVVATIGADGTWQVDIAGGALGGSADVSVVSVKTGVYQCTLGSSTNPITPTCVRLADPGKRVPKAYDPKVERLFRQWLTVFTDRQSALAVAEVQPLTGAQGSCFSVDSISASLRAPVDIGIYCYAADGVLTAARVDFGVLKLVNQVAGPPTVQLPGAEVPGPAMGTASPPVSSVDPPLGPVTTPSGSAGPAAGTVGPPMVPTVTASAPG
jgi:hypothetical protein